MAILSVNVDHVATLRQARLIDYPDPVRAAILAEEAGAEGITFHLREDRRHIQDSDLPRFKAACKSRLNMEMAAVNEMADIAIGLKPTIVTLVPEKRQELTTEGGLRIDADAENLSRITKRLQNAGIKVSYFIDPVKEYVLLAKEMGADAIELNTGRYSEATNEAELQTELTKIRKASSVAASEKIALYAGHGLNVGNISPLLDIPEIEEYNIGHSIVADSVYYGFSEAVKRMNRLIKGTNG